MRKLRSWIRSTRNDDFSYSGPEVCTKKPDRELVCLTLKAGEGQKKPQAKGEIMASETFYSKLAGVSARNPDGFERQRLIRSFCKPGMPLIFRREPDNPYDKNAIGVWIKTRVFFFFTKEIQMGYLNLDVAKELSKLMDRGGSVSGYISEVTGGTRDKENLGVNIFIRKGE